MRGAPVTFLEPGDPEEKSGQVSFRCPESLKKYVRDTAATRHRSDTDVWIDAIKMYRDLGERLSPMMGRLKEFAHDEGLTIPRDLPELIGRALERILNSDDRERKTKK